MADRWIWHDSGTNLSRRQSATTAGASTDCARVCLAAPPTGLSHATACSVDQSTPRRLALLRRSARHPLGKCGSLTAVRGRSWPSRRSEASLKDAQDAVRLPNIPLDLEISGRGEHVRVAAGFLTVFRIPVNNCPHEGVCASKNRVQQRCVVDAPMQYQVSLPIKRSQAILQFFPTRCNSVWGQE